MPSSSSQSGRGDTSESCKQHEDAESVCWNVEEGGISLAKRLRENVTRKMALEPTCMLGFGDYSAVGKIDAT